MQKFRKEKYIKQIQSERTKLWSFRVRYNGTEKVFNEKDFLSPSAAFKKAVEYRNSIVADKLIAKEVTVNQCYEEINDIYVIRSETKRKLDCFYKKYVHHKDELIGKVTRADIISDLNMMVDHCSDDTIQRVLSIWKKIFGVAIAKEYISTDLTVNITPQKSHKIKPVQRNELTDEQSLIEIGKLLTTSLKSPLESKQAPLMLMILYYTGMRPGEMFALNKSDIDIKKKTISINKEIGSDRESINTVRQCKTPMSVRTIPISRKCLPYIKEALKNDSELLFPNSQGGYYSSKDLGDKFHKISATHGYDFHFYQCRHTFITNLFMKGIDLKTIQAIVGQKVDATTIGYVVTDKNRMKNAIELV